MNALLLSLALSASFDAALEQALRRAVQQSSAEVEVQAWDAPRCRGTYTPAPFETSGRVAVRVRGKGCEAWGWATVKVVVRVATLVRDVKPEESLEGAWMLSSVEARRSADGINSVPEGAVAHRAMKRGAVLHDTDLHVGPRLGTAIVVRVSAGSLAIEQRGTVSACTGIDTCATLPSGKRVAGLWRGGVLEVNTP